MRIVAKAILAIILFLGITTPIHAAEPARQAVMATPPPGYGQGVGNVTQDSWARRVTTPDVPGSRLLYLGQTWKDNCSRSPFCIPIENPICGRWAEIKLNGLPVTVLTPSASTAGNWLPLMADTNPDPRYNEVKTLMPPANCMKLSDGSYQFVAPSRGSLILDVLVGSSAVEIDVTPYAGAEPVGPDATKALEVALGNRTIPAEFSPATLVPVKCHVSYNYGHFTYIELGTCQSH